MRSPLTTPPLILAALLLGPIADVARADSITLTVPGTANPWLAGQADGATANFFEGVFDSAPGQSPLLVTGLTFAPGDALTFSATGGTSHGPAHPLVGPDGGTAFSNHATGAENGIAAARAPLSSLVGIFLGPTAPDPLAPPGALNFDAGGNVAGGINYTSLSPGIAQVFFIGDGATSAAAQQEVIVPTGASQLYLGTMDGFQWANNPGSLQVTISIENTATTPEPSALALAVCGSLAIFIRRRRRIVT